MASAHLVLLLSRISTSLQSLLRHVEAVLSSMMALLGVPVTSDRDHRESGPWWSKQLRRILSAFKFQRGWRSLLCYFTVVVSFLLRRSWMEL